MNNKIKTYIYILQHPLTNEVKYVGKTIKKPKYRLSGHISNKRKSYLNSWIKSILPLKPKILVIDEVTEDWQFWEQYWISQFKNWGFKLCNLTKGGEGQYGNSPSKETIKKRVLKMRGRKLSDETKKKISDKHKGKVLKDETKNILREYAINQNGKPVLQFDLQGNFIKEYRCMQEAANSIKGCVRQIKRVCEQKPVKRKYKTKDGYKYSFYTFSQHKGYIWKFKI